MAPRVELSLLSPPLHRRLAHLLTKRDTGSISPALFIGIPCIILICLIITFLFVRQAARHSSQAPPGPAAIYPHTGPNQTCRNIYCTLPKCIRARNHSIVNINDPHVAFPAWRRSGGGNLAGCTRPACTHEYGTCRGDAVEMGPRQARVFRPADQSVDDRPPHFGEITDPPPAYVKELPVAAPEF